MFPTESKLVTTLKKMPFENIVGIQENAVNQHFLLFPQCFLSIPNRISVFKLHLFCCLQMLSIWTSLKIWRLVQVNPFIRWQILTFSQTTNYRLFQTEKLCRRQFQLGWKWQKVLQTGRKHCRKRRNCEQFLLFLQCFQKPCTADT